MTSEYAAKPVVEVDGAPLTEELDRLLEQVVVDDHRFLPDMVVLRFRDPDRDVLRRAGIEIGSVVRVFANALGSEVPERLATAEVTTLEASFDAGGSHAVVRGYDHSHRLHRGRITETYRNVTDSDVARTVAKRAGLRTGRIDETTTVHRHLSQANVSDWDFLAARAAEAGRALVVDDGVLEFRAPADAQVAPEAGDLNATDPLQLVLGANLESFRPRVTSAEQVTEVQVRGWDEMRKEAIVGRAPAATSAASLSVRPADLASLFGAPVHVSVDRPHSRQAEVDAAATVLADRIAGTFAEAEGTARGTPALHAGASVSVGLAGRPFEGLYTVTASRHVFGEGGYRTHFSVDGRQERSLLALASTNGDGHAARRIEGVVVAQVTNVRDPEAMGRVKLSFPWLSESYESDWVRTVQPGAGPKRGAVIVPEVNDEVLVAFEQGDVRRPYVIGGLYNGKDRPDIGEAFVDDGTGEVRRRGFVSRRGHAIVFFDDERQDGVAMLSGDRALRVSLNASDTVIKITSAGEVVIEADRDVTVKGDRIELSARSGVSIDGGSGPVEVKGTQIKLN